MKRFSLNFLEFTSIDCTLNQALKYKIDWFKGKVKVANQLILSVNGPGLVEMRYFRLQTSKTWFYNLPAAKATQFEGNRHLIVGASYLIQELGQKESELQF